MVHRSALLNTLLIDVGTPPKEWLQISSSVTCTTIILSLWESTVSLIENEWFLGKNQERFLAMVREHKVKKSRENRNKSDVCTSSESSTPSAI